MSQPRTIVKLFQIIMKTVQRSESGDRADKDLPRFSVQRNEIHQVQYVDTIIHKMQRPLKLPQVQYIDSTGQKVQQIAEISQLQYMKVEVPAEMQCPEIQCQNTATQHNKFHSLNGAIRTS